MYLENFKIYIMVILPAQQLKYYPLALLLIIVLLVDWFIIFIAVQNCYTKQTLGRYGQGNGHQIEPALH
jgi:hypothetical protein